jgi:hypothetical protein
MMWIQKRFVLSSGCYHGAPGAPQLATYTTSQPPTIRPFQFLLLDKHNIADYRGTYL